MSAYDELLQGEDGSGLTFEIYEDKAKEWRWRLLNSRSEIIAVSGEGHPQAQNCETEIILVKLSEKATIKGRTGLAEILSALIKRKNL
jgi:uncharacterized protein YegP (UPF0339 family)